MARGRRHCSNCGRGRRTLKKFGLTTVYYKCIVDNELHPEMGWCKDWTVEIPVTIACKNCREVYAVPDKWIPHVEGLTMHTCGMCMIDWNVQCPKCDSERIRIVFESDDMVHVRMYDCMMCSITSSDEPYTDKGLWKRRVG